MKCKKSHLVRFSTINQKCKKRYWFFNMHYNRANLEQLIYNKIWLSPKVNYRKLNISWIKKTWNLKYWILNYRGQKKTINGCPTKPLFFRSKWMHYKIAQHIWSVKSHQLLIISRPQWSKSDSWKTLTDRCQNYIHQKQFWLIEVVMIRETRQ